MKQLLRERPVLAWALYDWGNSAYATTVMAGFFPVFYSALSSGVGADRAQLYFNATLAVSSGLIALAAPILGAIADQAGGRKRFLGAFALLGMTMTLALAWVQAGHWWMGLFLYGLSAIGFSGANVFYDAMLVDVAPRSRLDAVSAFGYGLGYIGGGILFAINVLMAGRPQWFGMADASTAVRVSFVTVGLWWATFTVPLLLWTPDRRGTTSARRAVVDGLVQLRDTLAQIRRLRILVLFLAGYWLYIDAVNTVIRVAVFYGDRVLQLPRQSLVAALLVTQFIAFPAALAMGWLGQRFGPRPVILAGLSVYFAGVVYAWRFLDTAADFFILAAAVGLVQGGVQSLSRSLYARLVPPSKSAEFFGFFNMIGKFASILGPTLMALVPLLLPGAGRRDPILALSLLFAAGAWLLWRVDVPAGEEAARALDA